MGLLMGKFLIVSRLDRLEEYKRIAQEYQVAFEINDFFEPEILDSEGKIQQLIQAYRQAGIPEGSTMHGAFLDVTVFSRDELIRQISEKRMEQSMEIARQLGVRGVVFHTNYNPLISDAGYEAIVVTKTAAMLEKLLYSYPDLQIYLENMFDATPEILKQISMELKDYQNYGVCLDYAHACIYGDALEEWVGQLAPVVRHLHINDNDLKRDLHLAVGDGKIDWEKFNIYYRRYFGDCSVLLETTLPENQRKSLEYIRQLEGLYWEKENL